MSLTLGSLGANSIFFSKYLVLVAPALTTTATATATTLPLIHRVISSQAMSRRPNFQGGRRGGGGGGVPGRGGSGARGRGGGRGGGGRGEQRWWDPVWRAERLRQKQAEMEVLDENEWWNKMEQMKSGREQEMIIKRYYSRADQQTLSDMAFQLRLYL